MNKILFFGYGANRNINKMFQTIGSRPEGKGAVAEGFRLAYQSFDQIPEPAKSVLKKIWGSEFRAYTLKEDDGMVVGELWEITKDDFQKIKEWEFIGVWRELIEVVVKTSSGEKMLAFTDRAPDTHPVSGYVDGLSYDEYQFTNLIEKDKEKISMYYNETQLQEIRNNLKAIAR